MGQPLFIRCIQALVSNRVCELCPLQDLMNTGWPARLATLVLLHLLIFIGRTLRINTSPGVLTDSFIYLCVSKITQKATSGFGWDPAYVGPVH